MLISLFRPLAGLVVVMVCLVLMAGCSSEKFLGEGESVLSDVKVTSSRKGFKASTYRGFVRQNPNAKWFTLFRVPLGIYCMSHADSVKGQKGFSKVLRKIGEAPVVYDEKLTRQSMQSIEQALNSNGYLHARVDTLITRKRHKTYVDYRLTPGSRFYIRSLRYSHDSPLIAEAIARDTASSLLHRGMPLDLNKLAEERSRIVRALHENGYYYVNKDYLSFDIDTVHGELGAAVTVRAEMPTHADSLRAYLPQRFDRIRVWGTDGDGQSAPTDSVYYRGMTYLYSSRPKMHKGVLASHAAIARDSLYRESKVQNTYGNLNALPAVNFTTIQVSPSATRLDRLDCDIHINPASKHSIGFDVEGTNTAGDLGAALAFTYSNRNTFRGSEMLQLKLRGAYEAIRGLEGYSNQNYTEWSAEASLRFPTLLVPRISLDRKKRLKASSDAKVMYDMQDRPEFHRRVLTGSWSYSWNKISAPKWKHRYDLLSVNYVYMPWISNTFRSNYLEGDDPHYAVLRYSYENLFILKTGYNFTYNSLRDANGSNVGLYQTNGFQVRFAFEMAGNLLYGISKLTHGQRNADGAYSILDIAYSQYAKVDFDFSKSVVLGEKNSLAFHTALGLALPYGNSTILPYEKRYFAGGANSVRGWSVRELGPGAYKGEDGKVDFINQTGNLKLDVSVEWRTFLFWKLHGAFFVDAGNIWNTRKYAGLEEGQFRWNTFYKQIAVSYGLGLRLNFDYFIIRLDGAMKAIDPSVPSGRLHYPISRPDFVRDFALHFAVGLPF